MDPRKIYLFYFLPVFFGLGIAGFFIFREAEGSRVAVFFLFLVLSFLILSLGVFRSLIRPWEDIDRALRKVKEEFHHLGFDLPGSGNRPDEIRGQIHRWTEILGERIQTLFRNLAESQALLASMEEGVLILDPRGRVQKMNEAMARILGSPAPSLGGKHYLEIFRDPEIHDLVQLTFQEKRSQRRGLTPLGQTGKSFQVQSSFIRDAEGAAEGVVLVFHDVSDLKRLERVRQDFVANVSHELRTPLTAIKGYVEALRDGEWPKTSQAKQFLKVIEGHTDRMDKIVSDLLLLSEMESPDRPLKRETLSLSDLIPSAVETLHPLAEGKGQSLEVKIQGELPAVQGDSQKIHQVLINLLHNAISYTPEKGSITVEVRPVSEGVEVSVSDTGIGILPEDLPRIFERFYRVDKGRSRELGGTGLGLSIVKHIVEAHGGRVRVESKPGQGSRFTIFLPR